MQGAPASVVHIRFSEIFVRVSTSCGLSMQCFNGCTRWLLTIDILFLIGCAWKEHPFIANRSSSQERKHEALACIWSSHSRLFLYLSVQPQNRAEVQQNYCCLRTRSELRSRRRSGSATDPTTQLVLTPVQNWSRKDSGLSVTSSGCQFFFGLVDRCTVSCS